MVVMVTFVSDGQLFNWCMFCARSTPSNFMCSSVVWPANGDTSPMSRNPRTCMVRMALHRPSDAMSSVRFPAVDSVAKMDRLANNGHVASGANDPRQ